MKYRREIDGLRAVAVLAVILFHAKVPGFGGGYVGVDVFFVISGYLITSLIRMEINSGIFSLARFYERRARRILPALFFVMIVCMPAAWLLMVPYQLEKFARSCLSVVMFASNILFWREIGYFGQANEIKPLLHTWSLAVEEQYYLLFPLCALVLHKLGRRLFFSVLLAGAVASLILAHWTSLRYTGAAFFLAPYRAWEILLGALIALYAKPVPPENVLSRGWLGQCGSVAGCLLIGIAIILFDASTPTPSLYTLAPTLGAGLLILYATPETIIGRVLGRPLFVGIGLISYSAYLWHQPLFAFARLWRAEEPGPGLLLLLAVVSLGLAYFTWQYVERPARNKVSMPGKIFLISTGTAAAGIVCLGLFVIVNHGFTHRFPSADQYLAGFDPSTQGRYVASRFDQLRLMEFMPGRKKIFIVGDSFAQDFVNSFAENGYLQGASISTFHIASQCGAIISKEDFSRNIPLSERASCSRNGRFERQEVKARVHEADVVILVASWQRWQVKYLNETVNALREMGAPKVLIVGTKSFGTIAPLRYLGMSDSDKRHLRNPIDSERYGTNEIMRHILASDVFVDLESAVCGPGATAPVFTGELRLISFDGDHLTREGARYVGERLFNHPLLADLK